MGVSLGRPDYGWCSSRQPAGPVHRSRAGLCGDDENDRRAVSTNHHGDLTIGLASVTKRKPWVWKGMLGVARRQSAPPKQWTRK